MKINVLFFILLIASSFSYSQNNREEAFYSLVNLIDICSSCKDSMGSVQYSELLDYDHISFKINLKIVNLIASGTSIASIEKEVVIDFSDINPHPPKRRFLNLFHKSVEVFFFKSIYADEYLVHDGVRKIRTWGAPVYSIKFCFDKPLDIERFNRAIKILAPN